MTAAAEEIIIAFECANTIRFCGGVHCYYLCCHRAKRTLRNLLCVCMPAAMTTTTIAIAKNVSMRIHPSLAALSKPHTDLRQLFAHKTQTAKIMQKPSMHWKRIFSLFCCCSFVRSFSTISMQCTECASRICNWQWANSAAYIWILCIKRSRWIQSNNKKKEEMKKNKNELELANRCVMFFSSFIQSAWQFVPSISVPFSPF